MVVVFVRPLVAVFPRVGEIFDVQLFFLHIHINVCSLYEYAMSCVSVMSLCSLYEYAVSCVFGAATCMPTSGGLYHVDSLSKCCSRQFSKARWLRRNVDCSFLFCFCF